jgi:hypothetical protein
LFIAVLTLLLLAILPLASVFNGFANQGPVQSSVFFITGAHLLELAEALSDSIYPEPPALPHQLKLVIWVKLSPISR